MGATAHGAGLWKPPPHHHETHPKGRMGSQNPDFPSLPPPPQAKSLLPQFYPHSPGSPYQPGHSRLGPPNLSLPSDFSRENPTKYAVSGGLFPSSPFHAPGSSSSFQKVGPSSHGGLSLGLALEDLWTAGASMQMSCPRGVARSAGSPGWWQQKLCPTLPKRFQGSQELFCRNTEVWLIGKFPFPTTN